VHLLFSVLWIGGMLFMKLVLFPALDAVHPEARSVVFGVVAKRFTIVAWISTGVLLLTGVLKTPGEFLLDLATPYGRILLAKHLMFGLMILIGILITFVQVPRLRRNPPRAGSPPSERFLKSQQSIDRLSAINTFLGLAVLAVISFA
jgi:copper resistance protein D